MYFYIPLKAVWNADFALISIINHFLRKKIVKSKIVQPKMAELMTSSPTKKLFLLIEQDKGFLLNVNLFRCALIENLGGGMSLQVVINLHVCPRIKLTWKTETTLTLLVCYGNLLRCVSCGGIHPILPCFHLPLVNSGGSRRVFSAGSGGAGAKSSSADGIIRWLQWGNPGGTTEDALNSALEVWQTEGVEKRVDKGVDGDEDKMEIPQPVNQLTAAGMAEIHEIDHDAGGNIAGQKDTQHDQIGLGELVLYFYGSLTGLVLLRLTIVHLVDLGNLVFGVLENTNVREKEYKDGAEHGNVGENKSVGHKAYKKEERSETSGKDPDQTCRYGHSVVAGVSSVPDRLGDRQIAINS